jgi:hypothetical protein
MDDSLQALDDDVILKDLAFLAQRDRRNLGALLGLLGECEARRLYRDEGYHSLFEFCMRVLKYDENGAFRLVTASRVGRQFPAAIAHIAEGQLTLTAAVTLAPVLTADNHADLFRNASGKSRRELESMAVELNPLLAKPDIAKPVEAQAGWQAVAPVSPGRVRIGFDAGVPLARQIERAQQVLRHKYPDGRLEDVFGDLVEQFLHRRDPARRYAAPRSSTPARNPSSSRLTSRYIPARVKRAVWQRDAGRCAWRFEDGRICGSREGLEFDHLRPFAKGGRSEDERNVRLLCRMHNVLAAERAGLLSAPGESASRKSDDEGSRAAGDGSACSGGRAIPSEPEPTR